jgi:hypothetical protein
MIICNSSLCTKGVIEAKSHEARVQLLRYMPGRVYNSFATNAPFCQSRWHSTILVIKLTSTHLHNNRIIQKYRDDCEESDLNCLDVKAVALWVELLCQKGRCKEQLQILFVIISNYRYVFRLSLKKMFLNSWSMHLTQLTSL